MDRPQRYPPVATLRQRREFLRLRGGRRWSCSSFVVETRKRLEADRPDQTSPRIGYTVTKRIGNAVVRNRVKRRLRAAAAQLIDGELRDGYDYVLIARSGALKRAFFDLTDDLRNGLTQIHKPRRSNRAGMRG